MDRLLELLDNLDSLESADQLGELLTEALQDATVDDVQTLLDLLIDTYKQHRQSDDPDIGLLKQIAEAVENTQTRAQTLAEEAEAAEAELAALDELIDGPDEPEPADEPEPEAVEEPEPAVEDDPAEPVAATVEVETPAAKAEEETGKVAAAVKPLSGAKMRQHQPASRRQPVEAGRRWKVRAGGDLNGISAGSEIGDMRRLGVAFADRFHQAQVSGRPGRHVVASVDLDYPDDRKLRGEDGAHNGDVISTVLSDVQTRMSNSDGWDSLTASGGLCAPVDVRYDMFGVGDDRRPIRDAWVRFAADRGGVQFIAPPVLSDLATAVDVITEAEDEAGPTKTGLTITCGTLTTEEVSAIYARLQVGNFNRRAFPEQFDRFWQLANLQHAREAETELWDRAVAAGTAVTTGQIVGAARDILENIGQAAAAYRSRHRMPMDAILEVILPDWVIEMMRSDLTRQHAGDNSISLADQVIEDFLANRNVNVVFTPDSGQEFGAQGAEALLRWPDNVEALLYAPGTHLFLDGGTLDLGIEIRDTTLIDTNDVEAFVETFEGHAMVGVESLHLTMDVCPDGTAQAAADVEVCTTGS